MRKIYAIIIVAFLISSCKNIQKMVDKGQYDEAIHYAAEKLHGKKKKKTKHVKALEEAFFKVTHRDLDRIAYLEAKSNPEDYDRIFETYEIIKRRQEKISPFLPLISKDGYEGHFAFIDVNQKMADYATLATAYHYDEALKSLSNAEQGDKLAARRAYDRLVHTDKYTVHYKDKDALKRKAHFLGKTRILLEVVNNAPVILPAEFERHILSIDYLGLNSFWIEYFSDFEKGLPIDIKATLALNDLDVSPESEFIDRHTDEARIKDGFKYVTKTKITKDSLGNEIKTKVKVKKDKFKKVYADVIEIRRSKEAFVLGSLSYVDMLDGQILDVEPLKVNALFDERGLEFRGDHRALCGKHSKSEIRIGHFPSDFDLTMIAAENMKGQVKNHLKSFVF